jgi:protein-disulfide isomerase
MRVSDLRCSWPSGLLASVAATAVLAIARLVAEQAPAVQAPSPEAFDRWYATQPRTMLPVAMEGAAVIIVKFNDYQCPPCGKSYFTDRPILAKYQSLYPGAVRLVTKDFPLSAACNPVVQQTAHPAACEAAVAVRLARRTRRAEPMEEWLYSHQEGLTPAAVRQAAAFVAGVTDFDQAYAKTLDQVRADVALGQAVKINQTPTFFINGVRFNGEPLPQFLDMAIAYELRKAGKIKGPTR